MEKLRFLRRTTLSTDCDACGGRVDMIQGGVCTNCRRILCFRHLHGSWTQRIATELGVKTVCVACRRDPSRGAASSGTSALGER
jgi:hypothetical protein